MRVKRLVNYNKYCLFMSYLAHEKKRLGIDAFVQEYYEVLTKGKLRYIEKCYLTGLLEYYAGKTFDEFDGIKSNKVILDPHTYYFHFKQKDNTIIGSSLDEAIHPFYVMVCL